MKIPEYNVIDLEVTIRNTFGKYMKASPFCKENEVVMAGGLSTIVHEVYTGKKCRDLSLDTTIEVLVGQNLKFDLLWLLRDVKYDLLEYIKGGGKIWCTMLAEYLLTFQQSKWASLDDLATKYGGTVKDDRIKEFWDNGVDTDQIPKEMLKEYLANDLLNTEKVFLAQYQKAHELGMLPLIESQMDALMMTTLMEWNGMKFDQVEAGRCARVLQEELDYLLKQLQIHTALPNPLSPIQLSAWLFGGDIQVDALEHVVDEDGIPVLYKSGSKKGQVKTRKIKEVKSLPRRVTPLSSPNSRGYPVGNDDLAKVRGASPIVDLVIHKTLQCRELQKQVSTYFDGYSQLVWEDGMIHGQLNHTQTETGRLSSSKPNLQNASNKSSGD